MASQPTLIAIQLLEKFFPLMVLMALRLKSYILASMKAGMGTRESLDQSSDIIRPLILKIMMSYECMSRMRKV